MLSCVQAVELLGAGSRGSRGAGAGAGLSDCVAGIFSASSSGISMQSRAGSCEGFCGLDSKLCENS